MGSKQLTWFTRVTAIGVAVLMALPASAELRFKTPRIALEQGMAAFRAGNFELAIPALESARSHRVFPARYYLARIYSDNNGAYTDHGLAYKILREFVDDHADIDPADYRRAPRVSNALVRLAKYVRDGLPEIGLRPNVDRAVRFFHHSATFFNDEDAQFELAKLRLTGDGLRRSVPSALHWLAKLSRKGHPGAQAFLADLYWRGRYTKQNSVRALALITVAIENAPVEDRVWIEDIHQNIFCGATKGTRRAVTGLVATWRNKYGRALPSHREDSLSNLSISPVRTCSNGEPVRRIQPETVVAGPEKQGSVSPGGAPFQYGSSGNSYRNVQEHNANRGN
ncbi:MAG: tetratricopeptide repeat protein [Pseudomonadota bacterium]